MPTSADIVIVGGAVIGSATAYYLGKAGFRGTIVVVEKDPSYLRSSTARSVGGVRQQFSTRENIQLSQASLALVRELRAELGPEADVGFHEQGYLILASAEGRQILAANQALQRSEGADIVLLEPAALEKRFPWLAVDGLAAGALGLSGEGWIDPASLMWLLRKQAQGRGVDYVAGEVVGIEVARGEARAVVLAGGERIGCGALVNAAGPAAGRLAALAGIPLPVEPRKRFVYVLDCREVPPGLRDAPLTVDPTGIWFRPEGQTFLTGRSPEAHQEPTDGDLAAIDHAFFEAAIWPHLATRVPAFEAIKVVNAWAGFYDYNTLDQNGVIGAHPELANFYFANGFSGHGLQQAPAVGRAIAELIVHGSYQTIDLTRLGYGRIARGAPLAERNVI